jgi:hypothetical protein
MVKMGLGRSTRVSTALTTAFAAVSGTQPAQPLGTIPASSTLFSSKNLLGMTGACVYPNPPPAFVTRHRLLAAAGEDRYCRLLTDLGLYPSKLALGGWLGGPATIPAIRLCRPYLGRSQPFSTRLTRESFIMFALALATRNVTGSSKTTISKSS